MRCASSCSLRLLGQHNLRAVVSCIMARSKRKSGATTEADVERPAAQTTEDMEQQTTGARKARRASAVQAAGTEGKATETRRQRKQAGGDTEDAVTAKRPARQTKKPTKSTSRAADSNDTIDDAADSRGQAPEAAARPRKRGKAVAAVEGGEDSNAAQAESRAKSKSKAAAACPPVPTSGYWLMKNEPDELSMESLQEKPYQTAYWDGVRNYQARNFMRQMKIGDQIMFYYSSCKVPGIAGIAKVVKEAYPDHTAWDPKSNYYDPKSSPEKPVWDMVDVQAVRHLPRFLTLEELRRHSAEGGMLHGMLLFTRFRLSVMPLSEEHWNALVQLSEKEPQAELDSCMISSM